MALQVDWATGVITVPQADLTPVSGSLYEHDTVAFWAELKAIEASEEGIVFDDTQDHNSAYTVVGTTYAQKVEVVAPYSVKYEDTGADYQVRLAGSNNNLFDVGAGILVPTPGVTVIGQNAAGLVETAVSGLTAAESAALLAIDSKVDSLLAAQGLTNEQLVAERTTDPVSGKVILRNTAVMRRWEAAAWEDAAQSVPYKGAGLESVGQLVEVAWS